MRSTPWTALGVRTPGHPGLQFHAVILALLAACSDSSGPVYPRPPAIPKTVAVGDSVLVVMAATDTIERFIFTAPATGTYAAFAQVKRSSTLVYIYAEEPGMPMPSLFSLGGFDAGPLLASRSGSSRFPRAVSAW